ncbi:MAG: RNA 2',3'-cyclic phosphodiesterase [Phycisphaerae bacterium]|nr:RNA 2',3'-cyclic phosphodiesterase [Phycisphaerae bacterium]
MRCFVAIELPDDVRRQLAGLQEHFGYLGKVIRWVRPEATHLTLKFLGEVPDRQLPEVCRAVDHVARQSELFHFAVRSAGCFPPRGTPRVVWAGIEETSGRLDRCHALCEEAFAELGFPKEARRFVPHLTLGRVKDSRGAGGLREAVADYVDFEAGEVAAEELILFESHISKKGAEYVVAHRASLSSG